MYHQNPPPEAVPAVLPLSTAIKNRSWLSAVPLIALCCLGILGLLLAATIVLVLIPVYLPKRTVAVEANQRAFDSPADIIEHIEKQDGQYLCYISS
ncbi:unnamed protein product [Didymodactylos carnosus]|uniref:Uncharacterized protein n=1 Tax=Didymodactylos carnosus TaxID=1234261 RepID=A0A815Z6H4_9BILA|nr:unnamed protein product [Didymodactylos carnosus]CAF4447437.1 unnamed protein product [Didymodactylos carnosus]